MLRYLYFTLILLAFLGNPGCNGRLNLDQGYSGGALGGRVPARRPYISDSVGIGGIAPGGGGPYKRIDELAQNCKLGDDESCVLQGQRDYKKYVTRDSALQILMNTCNKNYPPACREVAKIKEQDGSLSALDDVKYLYDRACNKNDHESCLALRRIKREEDERAAQKAAAAEEQRKLEELARLERERKEQEEQAKRENSEKRLNSQLGQDIQKACFDGKPGSNLRTNPGAITPKRFCDCLAILLADPSTDDTVRDRYIKTLNPPPDSDLPVSKAILQQIETAAGLCMKRLSPNLPLHPDPSFYD